MEGEDNMARRRRVSPTIRLASPGAWLAVAVVERVVESTLRLAVVKVAESGGIVVWALWGAGQNCCSQD